MTKNPTHKIPRKLLSRMGGKRATQYMIPFIKSGLTNIIKNNNSFGELDTIYLELSKACNLNCIGCFNKDIHGSNEKLFELYPNLVEFLCQIPNVVVLGGEPFHPQTRQMLLKFIEQYSGRLTIITNGTLLDEEIISKLQNRFNVSLIISLDGDKEQNDSRRGKGTFETIKDKTKLLNKYKIFWGISSTMTSENIDFITSPEYVRMCEELGSYYSILFPYMPTSCSQNDEYQLTEAQYNEGIRKIETLNRENGYVLVHAIENETNYGKCRAGDRSLYLSANGDINPCPAITYSPFTVSELLEVGVEIVKEDKFLKSLREIKERTDGKCIAINHQDSLRKAIAEHSKVLKKTGKLSDNQAKGFLKEEI